MADLHPPRDHMELLIRQHPPHNIDALAGQLGRIKDLSIEDLRVGYHWVLEDLLVATVNYKVTLQTEVNRMQGRHDLMVAEIGGTEHSYDKQDEDLRSSICKLIEKKWEIDRRRKVVEQGMAVAGR